MCLDLHALLIALVAVTSIENMNQMNTSSCLSPKPLWHCRIIGSNMLKGLPSKFSTELLIISITLQELQQCRVVMWINHNEDILMILLGDKCQHQFRLQAYNHTPCKNYRKIYHMHINILRGKAATALQKKCNTLDIPIIVYNLTSIIRQIVVLAKKHKRNHSPNSKKGIWSHNLNVKVNMLSIIYMPRLLVPL